MDAESALYGNYGIHPCYELNNVSRILIRKNSTICVLLCNFLSLLSVVTTCGNLLVIISVIYFKQLHTPSNCLIFSLAVTDLLVGVVVFPFSTAYTLSYCLINRNLFCKIRDSIDVILSTSSIFNLCCISVDRYYAVCQPLMYRTKINFCVVSVMILMTWSVPVLIAAGFIVIEITQTKCQENCFEKDLVVKICAPLFAFYLPVIIMVYIYVRIYFVAQRQARSIHVVTKLGVSLSSGEKKATRTLAIVMGVFLICWLPFFLCFYIQLTGNVTMQVYEILGWFALSNSMLNPFIYAFFYSWFRCAFRIIISGKIFHRDFSSSKLG